MFFSHMTSLCILGEIAAISQTMLRLVKTHLFLIIFRQEQNICYAIYIFNFCTPIAKQLTHLSVFLVNWGVTQLIFHCYSKSRLQMCFNASDINSQHTCISVTRSSSLMNAWRSFKIWDSWQSTPCICKRYDRIWFPDKVPAGSVWSTGRFVLI